MSTNNELGLIKQAIEQGSLPGTETALGQIETAISAIAPFDGQLPGTENILTGLRVDIQANTNALLCVCNAINNQAFNDPTNNPLFPPSPPFTPIDPAINPPPEAEGWTLCKAAYAYIEYLATMFDDWAAFAGSPYWGITGLVAGILGAASLFFPATTAATVLAATAAAAGIWASLGAILEYGADEVFAEIASQLRTNQNLRSCMGAAFLTGSEMLVETAVDNNYEGVGADILKIAINQSGIDNYTNGYEEDGVMIYPQANDSDGCSCDEMGCIECTSGYQLVQMTGESVSVVARALYNSTCAVSRNGDRFTITGITATLSNYQEYWISTDLVITGQLPGTYKGYLFNVVSISQNANSLRTANLEWSNAFSGDETQLKLITPVDVPSKDALVECWDSWHGSYEPSTFPVSRILMLSSGATGGLAVEISFDVYAIVTC